MIVFKRDGRKAEFDKEKIRTAVLGAFKDIGEDNDTARVKANEIARYVASLERESITVEEIQDIIRDKLMNSSHKNVAEQFVLYRNEREKIRLNNSKLIRLVGDKLRAENVMNQNANVDERSFGGRIGEASRAVTKQYALDNLMSTMSKENHINNMIYIHDLDSYAVGMHNCYDSSTKFVTDAGVKSFGDCADGQLVRVIDKNGEWRDAVVHKYGKQKMYDLTFKSSLTTKTVTCTRNHRWVLEDGTITDNIEVGDSLLLTPSVTNEYIYNNRLWCFGFVIGDGCDFYMTSKDKTHVTNAGMNVRLCGDKTRYIQSFLECGWSIRQEHSNGDLTVISRGNGAFKQAFLDNEMWKIMSYDDICNIFQGYICADGHVRDNGSVMVSTSDIRVKKFIEDVSSVCGYYIWSTNEKHNSTNFKTDRTLYEFYLVKKQSTKWTLQNISPSRNGDNGYKVAWCVEEPITNTFTLDGCMVTGNCLSIPFDDLLANGFNTRQCDIRPANSINTAFQLIAVISQIQSLQQFGGVSATHLDWTMVPYVRKSFFKHWQDGIKYVDDPLLDFVATSETPLDEYPACVTFNYAMDMTERELKQAVEGMYHNLNSLQSRSGNQLPFTSINYGTCTLPEGRMVTRALLNGSIKGVGKHHRTSIFPCGIFKCKKGVNLEEGDPNYDLFKLALESTAKRLYPNYSNTDWSGNAGYDPNDPRTEFSTMGL